MINSANKALPLKVAVLANSSTDPEVGLGTQTVDDKYLTAALDGCNAVPIIIPNFLTHDRVDAMLDLVDGVILTGELSNIEPERYGSMGDADSHGPFNGIRDEIAFYLVHASRTRTLPILGICRGIQEINVALGGTLKVGIMGDAAFPDHLAIEKAPVPEKIYCKAHPVMINPETRLGAAFGAEKVYVNSVHVQAIDRLGDGLLPVAVSDDGIIEAIEHESDHRIIGVQWHPEYRAAESSVSMAVFGHFARLMEENRRITVSVVHDEILRR